MDVYYRHYRYILKKRRCDKCNKIQDSYICGASDTRRYRDQAVNIYEIEDYRPHITIQGFKSVHVLPVSLIEDIATGQIKISDVEGVDDFMPTLINEWLNNLSNEHT